MLPTAALPNPAEPGFIAIGGALGAFFGGTIARTLRYDADSCMRWAVEGGYYGTGIALSAYLAVNALEVGLS